MTLSYTRHQGQAYLARIDYTGRGRTVPTNRVLFHLEDRPDAVPLYTTNFLMKTAKRLKTNEVKANNRLVRAYKLTYTSSAGTRRSLLSKCNPMGAMREWRPMEMSQAAPRFPPMRLSYAAEERAPLRPVRKRGPGVQWDLWGERVGARTGGRERRWADGCRVSFCEYQQHWHQGAGAALRWGWHLYRQP